jgi:hypothetical protein
LSQTRSALKSHVLGTIIGIGIATGVTEVAVAFAPNLTVELAVGVALCAIVAHGPRRVCRRPMHVIADVTAFRQGGRRSIALAPDCALPVVTPIGNGQRSDAHK